MDAETQSKKALLFDSTLCIGCGACYDACKEKNNLPRTTNDFLSDKLSSKTFTVVKVRSNRFVRRMCMHCLDPTCASVCPVGALQKTVSGPVIYDDTRCMGCRYCMAACPFNIPTYQWDAAWPLVKKCTMCHDRLSAGFATACSAACPTGATKFGDRDELIAEARRRLEDNPGKYVNHIYGLEEVGGTSVLLISDVWFDRLGYRIDLPKEALPPLTWKVLQKIPTVVSVGGAVLSGLWWLSNRRNVIARLTREQKQKREENLEREKEAKG